MRFLLFLVVLLFVSCSALRAGSSGNWKVTTESTVYTATLVVSPIAPANVPVSISVLLPVETVDGTTTTSSSRFGPSTTRSLTSKGMAIEIRNSSDAMVSIEWDRWALVDHNGSSLRLVHSGIRLIARNEAQVPSMLAPHAKLTDIVVPAEAVSYQDRHWTILPYLPMESGKFGLKLVVGFSVDGESKSVVLDLPVEVECRHQSDDGIKKSC